MGPRCRTSSGVAAPTMRLVTRTCSARSRWHRRCRRRHQAYDGRRPQRACGTATRRRWSVPRTRTPTPTNRIAHTLARPQNWATKLCQRWPPRCTSLRPAQRAGPEWRPGTRMTTCCMRMHTQQPGHVSTPQTRPATARAGALRTATPPHVVRVCQLRHRRTPRRRTSRRLRQPAGLQPHQQPLRVACRKTGGT